MSDKSHERMVRFATEMRDSLAIAERAAFELAREVSREQHAATGSELRSANSLMTALKRERERADKMVTAIEGLAGYLRWREQHIAEAQARAAARADRPDAHQDVAAIDSEERFEA